MAEAVLRPVGNPLKQSRWSTSASKSAFESVILRKAASQNKTAFVPNLKAIRQIGQPAYNLGSFTLRRSYIHSAAQAECKTCSFQVGCQSCFVKA